MSEYASKRSLMLNGDGSYSTWEPKRGGLVHLDDSVSKGALLVVTARHALSPQAPLDHFVAWLRFYVDELA